MRLTIPDTDKNDFKAVCAKLMNRYPDELAEGSLSQIDFKKIQVKHFNLWSEKAYVRKLPVRYIGLQVHKIGISQIKRLKLNAWFSIKQFYMQ